MPGRLKIGRNDPCPCGSVKKYKHCCENHVDWPRIHRDRVDPRPFFSIRGRNVQFVNRICDALQLDSFRKLGLSEYKAAFTARAVRSIHEAVLEAWPPETDIISTLRRASTDVSGLYIGDYGLEYIAQGLVRHSIYASKILVVDPFVYPRSLRDEFNPILNPDQYRTQTLKSVNFFFSLLPWIEAGIVEVIRTPADFDPQLNAEATKRQHKKFEDNQELKRVLEESAQELFRRHKDQMASHLFLSSPDTYLRKFFDEAPTDKRGITADQFIAEVKARRENDPYFLEPLETLGPESGQLLAMTTGAGYEVAKVTAQLTGSYLVTDLAAKWKEIELDRSQHTQENQAWAPFAKAVQNAKLKYLNNLDLRQALTVRKQGGLEHLRSFLHRIWRTACTGDPFDESQSIHFANELIEEIAKAEEEWKEIDRSLVKMIGPIAGATVLAAGPLIASGQGSFAAAAAILEGGAAFTWSRMKRHGFPKKFPAAFFMKIK